MFKYLLCKRVTGWLYILLYSFFIHISVYQPIYFANFTVVMSLITEKKRNPNKNKLNFTLLAGPPPLWALGSQSPYPVRRPWWRPQHLRLTAIILDISLQSSCLAARILKFILAVTRSNWSWYCCFIEIAWTWEKKRSPFYPKPATSLSSSVFELRMLFIFLNRVHTATYCIGV